MNPTIEDKDRALALALAWFIGEPPFEDGKDTVQAAAEQVAPVLAAALGREHPTVTAIEWHFTHVGELPDVEEEVLVGFIDGTVAMGHYDDSHEEPAFRWRSLHNAPFNLPVTCWAQVIAPEVQR